MNRSNNSQIHSIAQSRFDLGQISPFKYFLGIAIVLGVLFAFISNQDDQQRPFYLIFIQWQLQTLIPILILIASHMVLSNSQWFETINPWIQLSISGLLGVLAFTPLALFLDHFFLSEAIDTDSIHWAYLDELAGVGPPVILSWVAMNAPWILGYKINRNDDLEGDKQQTKGLNYKSQLFQLLPEDIVSPVVCLKSELHYLEVSTAKGSALVLYNLKDAMNELLSVNGIQTHRSYWANIDFVESLKKNGRQGQLYLKNGQVVPVSRSRWAAVNSKIQKSMIN